ncbi:MAG TPA: radical SAM protein [Steroidobacteraceae bacterium]
MRERLRRLNERLLPGHLAFGPARIVLGVNNFCNLRCLMCDVGTGNAETNFGANLMGAKAKTMPWELFQEVVDQTASRWPGTDLAFVYTEPLAWSLLGKAVAYAHKKELPASVITNGLLLPRRAPELANGMCRTLTVSLDGPQAVHDRIRRRDGSYARAVEGIKALAALPDAPAIAVFCAITEWNAGSLVSFLREMSALPLERAGLMHNNFVTREQAQHHNTLYGDSWHATPSNVFETGPTRIDLELLSTELREIESTRYPFPVVINPHRTSLDDLTTYYHRPETLIGRRCNDVTRSLMIDSDGEAIPVHGRCFRFPIGNLANLSLDELWHHEQQSKLRRALQKAGGLLPACSRCCSGFGSADRRPGMTS